MSDIRLDWVSTYDAISLAHNMFMYYHALHVVFLLSCALSFVVILCLSPLSLSLSLSLLIMAPKKYVPSKNPICHGSSSFPYDFVQFHDKKAQDDFIDNFSN